MSFNELGLSPSICRALSDAGYKSPTSIQSRAIPKLLSGGDIIASADTGTGKTAAFMLPALENLIKPSTRKGKGPRVLVLTPTRELATQVSTSARTYGKHLKQIRTVSILGGMPYDRQQRDLRNFVDIMVATPGRLLDHHRDGRVDFGRVELLVLDEADRMLDMGFQDDVQTIVDACQKERQTVLFSATLGKDILKLAEKVTRSATRIEIEKSVKTHDNVEQTVLYADGEAHKRKLLNSIMSHGTVGQVIVFTATKRGAENLTEYLEGIEVSAVALHGDMRQSKRLRAIKQVRENYFKVLVATDVAARGIDIAGVTHVVNYDIPRTADDYTHRIGRTGRAGAAGTALTLVNHSERHQLRQLERFLGHELEVSIIPGLEPSNKPAPKQDRAPGRRSRGGNGYRGNNNQSRGRRSQRSDNRSDNRSAGRSEQRSDSRPDVRSDSRGVSNNNRRDSDRRDRSRRPQQRTARA